MVDGFLSGVLGGLFGPALMRRASKYRYWAIFVAVTVCVHLFLLISGICADGFTTTLGRYKHFMMTAVGILVPCAMGLLAVLTVVVCSVIAGKTKNKGQ
ncbi:hypothetical protein AWB82_07010 [Caballeronia glebae]|uniref:Uncharacterized protein n=1 Tax=Caballeronia glebae TaxID=1777143 RepID=A0A158DNT4_9BURK|nr:hypothetical protein AWB82_07010 [Caballeronia glebae]